MADFIPSTDQGKRAFGLNFSTIVAADFASLGISSGQSTAMTAAYTAYNTALVTATEPSTRTPSAIVAKDLARAQMVALIRELARIIQANPAVTAEQKTDLGLTNRDVEPSPKPVPNRSPAVDVVSVTARTVRVRLHDPENPTRRGRPDGIDGMTVVSCVSAETPTGASNWRYEGVTTRNLLDVVFDDSVPAGATVWVAAAYFNERKEAGPFSTPISTNLQGGASAQAA